MKDKLIVITGASDGIGAVAARELSKSGATVVVVGLSRDKTQQVADEINADYYTADFANLIEVRKLAADIKLKYSKIDVLINNAGGIFGERELTVDGHEKTLQVNHLAPFLLTNLLMNTLILSKAKVINTSSIANEKYGNIDIDDLDLNHNYSPNRAYGNSKLANILFTKELHKRHNGKGISTAAVHPGNIATHFARNSTSYLRFIYGTFLSKLLLESPMVGAESLTWLAMGEPGVDWQSGFYYEKHKLGKENIQASDENLAQRLWELSEIYTGLKVN